MTRCFVLQSCSKHIICFLDWLALIAYNDQLAYLKVISFVTAQMQSIVSI